MFFSLSFRRHVLSLHLNGSSTLMKNLQLLFAILAHTQVSDVLVQQVMRKKITPYVKYNMLHCVFIVYMRLSPTEGGIRS